MPNRKTFYVLAIIFAATVGIGIQALGPGAPQIAEASTQKKIAGAETRPFVKGSLASIVEGRNGRPFLMVFWSTYCSVCLAEMDVWRELLDERDDFELVMVATNKIETAEGLETVLSEKGLAGVEAWAFADPIPARVRADVDKAWRGALPYIHLYGRDGRVKVVTGRMHKKDVEAWLDAQMG